MAVDVTEQVVQAPAALRGTVRTVTKANKLLTAENSALRRALLKLLLQDGEFDAIEGIRVMDHFRPQSDNPDDIVEAYTILGISTWLDREAS